MMSKNIKLILGILVGLCVTEQVFGAQQQLGGAGMAFPAFPVVAPVVAPQNGPAQPPVLRRKRKAPLQLLPQYQVALVILPLSTPRGSDAWCAQVEFILTENIYQFLPEDMLQVGSGLKFILSELRTINTKLNNETVIAPERGQLLRAKNLLI